MAKELEAIIFVDFLHLENVTFLIDDNFSVLYSPHGEFLAFEVIFQTEAVCKMLPNVSWFLSKVQAQQKFEHSTNLLWWVLICKFQVKFSSKIFDTSKV